DAVDDVQTKSGTALIPARCEERIKGAAANVEAHAAAIVGENYLDIVLARRRRPDVDQARSSSRKRVRERIEKQVGQHLTIGAGIRVHDEVGLTLDVERQIVLPQAGPETHHHLLGQVAEIEAALVGIISVGGNLLEGLDQLSRTIEIGDKL